MEQMSRISRDAGAATNESTVWSLDANVAELNCRELSGRIDTARPDLGLHTGAHTQRSLLGVCRLVESGASCSTVDPSDAGSWPLPIAEAYIRGGDLVASYRPIEDWPFSPQLYWRANTLKRFSGAKASLSLLVSVQTHLLDTYPKIVVHSGVPSDELLHVSASKSGRVAVKSIGDQTKITASEDRCCFIWRLADSQLSYVEVAPPGDFREARLQFNEQEPCVEWHLFSDFLEKGVIWRGRIHAVVLPRENDVELAMSCFDAVERLELPLTT
jgi:hypothetical protein